MIYVSNPITNINVSLITNAFNQNQSIRIIRLFLPDLHLDDPSFLQAFIQNKTDIALCVSSATCEVLKQFFQILAEIGKAECLTLKLCKVNEHLLDQFLNYWHLLEELGKTSPLRKLAVGDFKNIQGKKQFILEALKKGRKLQKVILEHEEGYYHSFPELSEKIQFSTFK